jgi:hypothetical protein
MKKFIVLLLIAFAFSQTTQAQTPPFFNSDSSTQANVAPFNPDGDPGLVKVQHRYGPGEFMGAPNGHIDTIWVRAGSDSLGSGPYVDFEVSLGQNVGTTITVTPTFNTGLTSVYKTSSFTIPAVVTGDWVAIPLTTPFLYNPALSLVVEIKSKGNGGSGVNVFRGNEANRRVYGAYVAATGTLGAGPIDLGLTITPSIIPQYFNSNTTTQANQVPFNPDGNPQFRKGQQRYAPGEFTGAPNGNIETVWVRAASDSLDAGPYLDFEISMGQNVGTSTTVTDTFNTELTSVFSDGFFSISDVEKGDWIAIPLATPFFYNPSLSLVVEIKSKGNAGSGIDIYRGTAENRRVFGSYPEATGTVGPGPVDFGLSISPAKLPPYFNSDSSTQANQVPFNPDGNPQFRKGQQRYAPGEFAGAPNGHINTLWVRMASVSPNSGPYVDFEISMGQNVGTSTVVSNTFTTGLTSVFKRSAFSIPAVAVGDWFAIPLSTPFLYDPSLSLVVEIKSKGNAGFGVNIYRGPTANRRVYGDYAGAVGTLGAGPIDLGITISLFQNSFE